MQSPNAISPDRLRELSEGRPLFLWGASQAGIGVLFSLRRLGFEVAGVIDRRAGLFGDGLYGAPVLRASQVLAGPGPSPFIIDATFQHKDEIIARCQQAGLQPGRDLISHEALNPYDYQVVVCNACNLRCISCPLGNIAEQQPTGLMSLETFGQVLDKLLLEVPYLGIVQLYNWGEPLLHPQLPDMIRLAAAKGVLCAVSSNLSLKTDLEPLLREGPGYFRVSLSGWGPNYARTHNKGDWQLVKANMERLAILREQYCPQMPIEAAFHIYRHNLADFEACRDFCGQRGIIMRPHLAALLPLDNPADYLAGKPLSPQAIEVLDMLKIPLEEALALAKSERHLSCNFEHAINIDWDLSVKQCGLYFRREGNVVADNYLETSLESIMRQRKGNVLCTSCRKHGLHRFCRTYTQHEGFSSAEAS